MKAQLHYRFIFTLAMMMRLQGMLHAQTYQWVSTPSGYTVNGVATDAVGNVYVSGYYDGTVTIGSFTLLPLDIYSGLTDIFVAKYNSSGTVLWAKNAGGSGDDKSSAICVDDSGHCYVTGTFQSSAVFGSDTLTTSTGGTSFITKYNGAHGTEMWAKGVRTTFGTGANAIAVDDYKVCIAGWFYNNAIIGLDTLSDGDTDPMLAAFNSHTGAELWGRQGGEYLGVEDAQDVAIDASGKVYYCGHFFYTSYFSSIKGSLAYPALTITANGSPDFFIAVYESSGGLLNVVHADAAGTAYAKALEVDAGGTVYCAGTFNSTLTVGGSSVTSPSGSDIFVLKISSAGVPSWLVSAEGNTSCACSDNVNALALDASGNTYITGTFTGSFGWQTVFGTDTISGFNGGDIYVAMLNSSGEFQWAESAGGYNEESGNDLAEDGAGNVYVGGSANGDFGALSYFSHVSYAPPGTSGFVGKINTDLHTGPVATALCTGTTISVPYTSDVTLIAGNVYTVQLSNAAGLFNAPTTLATKTTKSKTGSISVTIPSVEGGNAYRIRVISSSPSRIGRDNGKNISIGTMSIPGITPPGPITACTGTPVTLSTGSCSYCTYQWLKGSAVQSGATSSSFTTTSSGTFKVQVTNFGCSKTSGGVSISRTSPTASVTPSGTVDICSTGSVVLTASAGAGYSYKWKKGSAYIPGATSITYTATKAASYKAEVTDAIGCSKLSAATKVIKSCKESDFLSEEYLSSAFAVYPNPAKDFVTVSLPDGVTQLFIVAADGRIMLNIEPEYSSININIKELTAGIYVIRVLTPEGHTTAMKLVKE